jgi:hypothetical protein
VYVITLPTIFKDPLIGFAVTPDRDIVSQLSTSVSLVITLTDQLESSFTVNVSVTATGASLTQVTVMLTVAELDQLGQKASFA